MKRIAIFQVSIPPDSRVQWEDYVPRYALNADWHEPLNREKGKIAIYCKLDTQDDKYTAFLTFLNENGLKLPSDIGAPGHEDRFQSALRSKGVTWSIIRIEHHYTDEELREFPLLMLGVTTDPVGVDRSPRHGTLYDMTNACKRCGTGAVQVSPLMLPLKGLRKKGEIAMGPSFEEIVGAKLHQALLDAKVSGIELRQSRHYQNNEPLPWWQIISKFEMPKMSKQSRNLCRDTSPGWGCPVCERDMHAKSNNEPLDYVYDRDVIDPAAIPDVVHTWECFGRSVLNDDPVRQLVCGYAFPAILIKPRVFDILRRLKIKNVDFLPVRFV